MSSYIQYYSIKTFDQIVTAELREPWVELQNCLDTSFLMRVLFNNIIGQGYLIFRNRVYYLSIWMPEIFIMNCLSRLIQHKKNQYNIN